MIKQKIKYVDFDDTEKEETLYFNLTAAELADIEIELGDGLQDYIETIVSTDANGNPTIEKENNVKVWNLFKTIISKAYGEKTQDGRFVKNSVIKDSFLATEAYSQLFLRFIKEPETAKAFIKELSKVKGVKKIEDQKVTNVEN